MEIELEFIADGMETDVEVTVFCGFHLSREFYVFFVQKVGRLQSHSSHAIHSVCGAVFHLYALWIGTHIRLRLELDHVGSVFLHLQRWRDEPVVGRVVVAVFVSYLSVVVIRPC